MNWKQLDLDNPPRGEVLAALVTLVFMGAR